MSLDAGRDLTISAALNTGSSSVTSSSAGAGLGLKGTIGSSGVGGGIHVSAQASGSNSSGRADTRVDAVVAAGDTLSTSSGRDTTVAGAHLEGDSVWMDVGRNLTVASLQDYAENESSSWSAGGSVTVGTGVSASLSVGGGQGSGTSDWTDEQTSIIGHGEVDIRVEDHTHIKGGIIGAENGNLVLDTGTLTYEAVQDRDHGSRMDIQVGMGFGDPDQEGGVLTPSPDSVEAAYAAHDKEGVLFPTVGEGTIIVRDDPDTDLSGLNRDLETTRVVTRDDEVSMDFYGSKQSVETIGKAIKTLSDLVPQAKNLNDLQGTPEEKMAQLLEYASDALRISSEDRQSISHALGDEGALKLLIVASNLKKYGSLEAMPEDKLLEAAQSLLLLTGQQMLAAGYRPNSGDMASDQAYCWFAPVLGLPASELGVAAGIQGGQPAHLTAGQAKQVEKTLLTLVFITLGGTDTERTWLEIQSLWQKATGTALPPEWKDGLLEHIPPALPPVGTPPTPGGTMPEPGVETYPSEENPSDGGLLPHPDLPEGQGTGIHDQTPPVVDIPPIIQNEDGKSISYLPANSEDLFKEMSGKGVKFTKENVIALEKMPDGRIIFLEDTPNKGLDHIWQRHGAEFEQKGIKRNEMPLLVMKAVRERNIIGYQGKEQGRPIYSVEFKGQTFQLAITVGSNGFIVGANLNSKGK